tara:strand:- start:497 stop:1477 length:981 start_codon:yes stop_codon:yes gene_type:complete
MSNNRDLGGDKAATHSDRVIETVSSSKAASSPLAASWSRSLNYFGLEPDSVESRERSKASEIKARQEELGLLLSIAQPAMDQLHATINLAGCSVFLSDSEGVVIDQRHAASDADVFETAGLSTGFVWSEAREGTNGIGTCAVDQRPVTIHQNQHFQARNTVMSCMGAPIFDPAGRLAAVLDVSSFRNDLSEPFASLVTQTVTQFARQIESDHFQQVFGTARIIRGEQDGATGAVLFAVDRDDLLIGATRHARHAYGLNDDTFAKPQPAGSILDNIDHRAGGLEGAEKRAIRRAIAAANGNVTAAARALKIGRATLYRRMQALGISR